MQMLIDVLSNASRIQSSKQERHFDERRTDLETRESPPNCVLFPARRLFHLTPTHVEKATVPHGCTSSAMYIEMLLVAFWKEQCDSSLHPVVLSAF